ncbi:MAG TPA: FAD-dependent oxidoreductase [Edaphobacter sp.]|uniref:FAD-dependent oxidoreductase n=1 Tax=Edaphobacter sp. TaxID=1934404 RepID=UPI002B71DE97|nr:FAD-dependent oxidoreductase [Edaphobacter sp.]HUZ93568.1 FAD-dependent oxidoreductase [Edaphobacter sp.]
MATLANSGTVSSAEQPEDFDLVILGTGEGAKFVAWTLARQGKSVAIVERRWIGGACPNIACLPSKNIIHSAKVASYFSRAAEFGITTQGYQVDMVAVMGRKRGMVKSLVDIHVRNFNTSGTVLVMGEGRFVAPKTVEVALSAGGTRYLRGEDVLIGTGTRARLDNIPGLSDAKALTHIEVMELDVLPEHLVILGGGYIGLEFAQAMRRLGSRVSIIERNSSLLHDEDVDVTVELEKMFKDEGIELILNASVEEVSGQSGKAVDVAYKQDGLLRHVKGTHLLVAAGRLPNTENLGLELTGVETAERGYIKVDERLQTTAAGIWAVGDVTGGPQFTHISFDDFRIVRDNITGGARTTTGRLVPFAMFTDPELAHVGLREHEAKAKGVGYRIFKIPMISVLRTRTLSETRGFMKALVGRDDKILGFTVFGIGGGEIMSAIQLAMMGGLPYTAVRDAVLTHPTLMEGLIVLFSSAPTSVEPS